MRRAAYRAELQTPPAPRRRHERGLEAGIRGFAGFRGSRGNDRESLDRSWSSFFLDGVDPTIVDIFYDYRRRLPLELVPACLAHRHAASKAIGVGLDFIRRPSGFVFAADSIFWIVDSAPAKSEHVDFVSFTLAA